jgi:hypothetical protein
MPCAIDEKEGKLVSPSNASKDKIYKCICCDERVIFRAGDVNRHHFAHKPNTNCPSSSGGGGGGGIETFNHKHAKLLLVDWLRNHRALTIEYECRCPSIDKKTFDLIVPDDALVFEEYRMEHEGSLIIPDIAIVVNGYVLCIIEICHTHKQENRPEPWFEFKADDILSYKAKDLRERVCEKCCDVICGKCGQKLRKHNLTKEGLCNECDWKVGEAEHEAMRKRIYAGKKCEGRCFTRVGTFDYERDFDCGQGCKKEHPCKGCNFKHPLLYIDEETGMCPQCHEYGPLKNDKHMMSILEEIEDMLNGNYVYKPTSNWRKNSATTRGKPRNRRR